MGDSRKGKSVWKRYEKPRVEARTENDGKLFYRINKKTGRVETNLLEWERSWKNVKILKYPTRFANELRLGVRDNPTVEDVLAANAMLPEVDVNREYWNPTPEEMIELLSIENQLVRDTRQTAMFLAWRQAQQAMPEIPNFATRSPSINKV